MPRRLNIVNPLPTEFWFEKVRTQSEVMWKDEYCGKALRLAIGLAVLGVGLLVWKMSTLPPQIPLYYSRPWGEKQLGSPWELWWLPGLNLAVLGVNLLIGGIVFSEDKLLSKMLVTAATLTGFLTVFALGRIFWLVT